MGLTTRMQAAWGALRSDPTISMDQWLSYFTFHGNPYSISLNQTLVGDREEIGGDFTGLVGQAYRANGVIFACILARMMIFSEARFQFRQQRNGRPGDLFGNASLGVLERPWVGGTTGDLLSRALLYADLAGQAFLVRRPGPRIKVLRPDWCTMILGSMSDPSVAAYDIDAEIVGLVYHPGGRYSGVEPEYLRREEFAHFAPVPDPMATYRGMSWLTPIIRETMADSAATSHKLRFFENGMTPNLVIKNSNILDKDKFREWVRMMREGHEGEANAYKTLFLAGGADASVVGNGIADFKITQGAGETRIAAAAGVHPVIVGLSEGMQGSSLNAGNFSSARRLVADRTMRPLWRNMAGSLEMIVPPPPGSQLWYDDRDIAFLREDRKDAAEIQQVKAASIRQLVDAGYEADSVVKAVEAEDMGLLVHTGLFSVQLMPPKTAADLAAEKAAAAALTNPPPPEAPPNA